CAVTRLTCPAAVPTRQHKGLYVAASGNIACFKQKTAYEIPMNGRQFVYHMSGLTKTYPGNRKVLENVHLQFYPDAKIGVLGVNGAGKSTLLRIMAGIDNEYSGGARGGQGAPAGHLPQRHRRATGTTRRA